MVIAEVNPAMTRTHGESFDAMVDVDVPVTEYLHPKIGEVAERVARYIASIIEDGDEGKLDALRLLGRGVQ